MANFWMNELGGIILSTVNTKSRACDRASQYQEPKPLFLWPWSCPPGRHYHRPSQRKGGLLYDDPTRKGYTKTI